MLDKGGFNTVSKILEQGRMTFAFQEIPILREKKVNTG
jgi:hypothetical protein